MTPAHAVCYDLAAVSRFFHSVALSIAISQHLSINWETYRGSATLNVVYSVLFWKEPPGNAEVQMDSKFAIDQTTNRLHQQFLFSWINKLHSAGPLEAQRYVGHMELLRSQARQNISDVFRSASDVNAEVAGETDRAIANLARIRLGAAVGVAIIGGAVGVAFAAAAVGGATAVGGISLFGIEAGASATVFGVVGVSNAVINSVIKTWDKAPVATVAAITMDAGKAVVSEVGGRSAVAKYGQAFATDQNAQQVIKSAQGLIKKYSERLANEALKNAAVRKSRNIIARSNTQVVEQTVRRLHAQNILRAAGGAARAVPVIFAAWDILEAWGDYKDTMAEISR